jgi:heme/copper-type cytochrome/quinol oxidase subunit 2
MNIVLLQDSNAGAATLWIWLCVLVATVVFAIILYSIATFRPIDTTVTRHSWGEFIWAIVPIAIVIAAAVPALNHGRAVAPANIDVLARQDRYIESCMSATTLAAVTSPPRLATQCPAQ